jgi:hypothetical protein
MNPLGNISNRTELSPLTRIVPTDMVSPSQTTGSAEPVGVFPKAESVLGLPPQDLLNDPMASRQVTWAQNQAASLMTGPPMNPELAEAREIDWQYQAGMVGPEIGEPNRQRLSQLEARADQQGQPNQGDGPSSVDRPSPTAKKSRPTRRKRVAQKSPAKKTAAKTTTQKQQDSKTDGAKTEKKAETPKSETTKSETTKSETTKTETTKTETTKTETPKTDSKKTETPKTETQKPDPKKTETTKTDSTKVDSTKSETTKTDTTKTETPKTEEKKPVDPNDDANRQLEAGKKADGIIAKNTNTLGMNYDESGMGKDLAASKDPRVVRETLNKLDPQNRKEVSSSTVNNLSDQEIRELSKTPEGRSTLTHLGGHIGETNGKDPISSVNKAQLDRIEKLTGTRPQPFNNHKTIKYSGQIPKALDDANNGGGLDLSRVTPEMMNNLTPDERAQVVKQVDGQKVITLTNNPRTDKSTVETPSSAEDYFLSNLSSQKDSSQAVTQTFANLSPETRSKVNLNRETSKEIVEQMPLLVKELHSQPCADGTPHNGTLTNQDSQAISNVVKQYPAETKEELNTLSTKLNEAKEVLPKTRTLPDGTTENIEKYNEGWLTGATLRGFHQKGEAWKQRAKDMDLLGEGIDVLTAADPTSIVGSGLKLGLKSMIRQSEKEGDKREQIADEVITDVRDGWKKNQKTQDVDELNQGFAAGSGNEV